MTEAAAAPSDILQPGKAPAAPSAEQPPIKATFHFNTAQGIQPPASLFPDGKIPAPVIDERHLDTYRKFGVGEDVIKQVAERRSVSAEEFRLAQHAKANFMGDVKKVRAYLDGDVDLRRTMMTLNIILSSKIEEEPQK